jgi:hypothetical protein
MSFFDIVTPLVVLGTAYLLLFTVTHLERETKRGAISEAQQPEKKG